MADRYIVGTGSRNINDTAIWSATDGGAGGASVPTSSDNVFKTANSGTGTITVNANFACANFTCTGANAITFSSSVYTFSVYGAFTREANTTFSFTGTAYMYFKGTTSVNITMGGTSGCAFNRLYFDGVGGTWVLQDEMNIATTEPYLINGTWNHNNNNVTTIGFVWGSGTKTLTLGSGTFDTKTGNVFFHVNPGTFNCGTSTIRNQNVTSGGGLYLYTHTYYNIECYALGVGSSRTPTINNLTITYQSSGTHLGLLGDGSGNITVNGVLTLTGYNSSTRRVLIYAGTIGTPRTITCNGTIVASNVDFRDITLAGTASRDLSAITGGSGDCGGNSGITFTTAQPLYFKKHASTANVGDAANWFTDEALTVAANRIPLPQDRDSKFLAGSFNQACVVTCNVPRIPNLDMSAVNQAVTFTLANAVIVHGSFRTNSFITITGNFVTQFDGHGKTLPTIVYLGTTNTSNNFDVLTSNNFTELVIDAGRKVRITAGTTQTVNKLTAIGTNDNPITLGSVTAAQANLVLAANNPEIECDYINVSYINATPVNKWFMGENSTDGGNNTGLIFKRFFQAIINWF